MRSSLIVAVGGVIGASARWGVGRVLENPPSGFPWATFIVNVIGCLLVGLAARRMTRHSDAWLGAVVGVLGGLTTFSAFAVETRSLLDVGRPVTAAAYVTASMIVGISATELARSSGAPPS